MLAPNPTTSPTEPTALSPADGPASPRIQAIDIIRGVAIMGILIVHFTSDFSGIWLLTTEKKDALSFADANTFVDRFIGLFITDKARTIFSFMFGVSFYLQLSSANRRGVAFRPLFLRRLAVLLVIGLLHAHLLFGGDILRYYVVGGLFLLLAYRWPSRRLIQGGILLTIVAPLLMGITMQVIHMDAGRLDVSALLKSGVADSYWGYLQGDYLWATWFYTPGMVQIYCVPVLGNFLFGVWMARTQYIQNPHKHHRPLKRLFWLGLSVGVVSKATLFLIGVLQHHQVTEVSFAQVWVSALLRSISYEALALCYICGIALLCRFERWQRRLAVLAPAGRMTLTNYVGQSVLGMLIFDGFGLGLFDTLGSAPCLLMALGIGGFQLGASHWWLQRFRMGPLEWIWRSLASGRWQRLRISTPLPVPK